jgi:hypothetical protein
VDEIRSGPPALSVFRVPGMDERLNTVEYFVHHEDVRRGADGWEPRDIGAGLTEYLWQRLRSARYIFRKAPVGIELVRDDRPAGPGRPQVRITAKARVPMVTVHRAPGGADHVGDGPDHGRPGPARRQRARREQAGARRLAGLTALPSAAGHPAVVYRWG